MTDLSAEEVCDLFLAAQLALEVTEEHFAATASTMSVQDGKEAGETVVRGGLRIGATPKMPADGLTSSISSFLR